MKPAILTLTALALTPAAALAQDRPQMLATVGMIADVAATIGGDCVDVAAMMGPGIDPHLYQPTPADVRALQGADAVLFVGLGLEGQLASVLDRLGASRPTLSVGQAVADQVDLPESEDAYGVDPHLWMDVSLWRRTIAPIGDLIANVAPGCDGLQDRAAQYEAQLEALHAWVGDTIATIPQDSRALVTAHDAFGYFARAYGIEEVALQGMTTEAEASIADLRETAAFVADRNIPAVFVESTINPRSMTALTEAIRDRGHDVALGGQLFSDAMGDAGTPEGTYVGMIRANTLTIAAALGGTPADWPDALGDWAGEWGLGNP